jgi:hypothetical protein
MCNTFLLTCTSTSRIPGRSGLVLVGLIAVSLCNSSTQRHSLFGITTLQVYIYYQHYSGDKLQNRIVVGNMSCLFVWPCNSLQPRFPFSGWFAFKTARILKQMTRCRIMDAFHLALAIHAVYFYLVNQLPFIYIIWYVCV